MGKKKKIMQDSRSAESDHEHDPDWCPLSRHLESQTVRIRIPGRDYHVHEGILVERSAYFKRLITGKFSVPDNTVNLKWRPEFALGDAFDSLLEYFYTLQCTPDATTSREARCIHSANIYVLADYLRMPDLQAIALQNFEAALVVTEQRTMQKFGGSGFGGSIQVEHEKRPLRFNPAIALAIQRVLYENPFDVDSPTTSGHVDQAEESGPQDNDEPLQSGDDEDEEPARSEEGEKFPHVDWRNPAREAFVRCLAQDLPRLLEFSSCRDLFFSGGDFVVDLLRHSQPELKR